MSAEYFLDTNVLLYASSNAPADEAKRQRAHELMMDGRFAVSIQVLQEFIANALRKKSLGITESNIDALLELAIHIPIAPITHELIIRSTKIRRKYSVSPWDAAILAAALKLGCPTLYSEDFNHGQTYEGVRVINPFLN